LSIAPKRERNGLNAWSNGWTIWINSDAAPVEQVENPLAAAAAGAAAAASIHLRSHHQPVPNYIVNLLTYTAEPVLGEPLRRIQLPRSLLAGVGAVGGSFALAMASLELHGRLDLVDTERFSERNLARYTMALPSDLGKDKAAVAAQILRPTGLSTQSSRAGAARRLHRLGPRRIVIAATDTAESRRDIAAELPESGFDAANAEDEPRIEIARFSFAPDGPCLACFYPVSHQPDDLTSRIQRDLGLTFEEITKLRATGKPLDERLRQLIAKRTNSLLPMAALGEGIDTVYTSHYCGSEPASPRSSRRAPLLPTRVFAPSMAGILLAAEVVKKAMRLASQQNWFSWDLSRPPNPDAYRFRGPRAGCNVCSDSDYQHAYAVAHRPRL
jgi:molybdopterin/thiamine biosynthesis adenylyltransferase